MKGTATLSLTDLRELLTDPDTRRNERNLHFRFILNGKVLREFRSHIAHPQMVMPVDLTWLILELAAQHGARDLRVEITPES